MSKIFSIMFSIFSPSISMSIIVPSYLSCQCIQLTLEQHWFEVHGLCIGGYLSMVNTTLLHNLRQFDSMDQKPGYGGTVDTEELQTQRAYSKLHVGFWLCRRLLPLSSWMAKVNCIKHPFIPVLDNNRHNWYEKSKKLSPQKMDFSSIHLP